MCGTSNLNFAWQLVIYVFFFPQSLTLKENYSSRRTLRFDQECEDSSVPAVIASLREILLMTLMRIITTQHTVIMPWNRMSHKPFSCTVFLLVIFRIIMKQLGKDCTNILIMYVVNLSFLLASLFYLNTVNLWGIYM